MTVPVDARLDARKSKAIAMLVEGERPSKVAAELGVDDRTLRRWREDPAFVVELEGAKREAVEGAKDRLGGLVACALDALEQVLVDVAAPPAARLRAVEIVLARAGLDGKPAPEVVADPADVQDVLAYMRWRDEHGRGARDEGDDAA